MVEMTKEEQEKLRLQAIEGEELILSKLNTFLDNFPLNNDINKAVALELAVRMSDIEKIIEDLKRP